MASKIRTEVNASIRTGIHDRMSAAQRAGLMRLLEERDPKLDVDFPPLREQDLMAADLGQAA
ncbi:MULTISPECIES: hypothetical protein [unclassified Streptomyces]|uniref:hypothetical protein n=1 Tax=unclassified Streptomyces TaxID=2593676 RepID=UPI0036E6F607